MAKKPSAPRRKKTPKGSELYAMLRSHFGTDPSHLPVIEQEFQEYHRPNLHLSLQEMIPADGDVRLTGVVTSHVYDTVTLSKLSRNETARQYQRGPVEYRETPLADNRTLACVNRGLYLFNEDSVPIALLLVQDPHRHTQAIQVSIMSSDREAAERFVRKLTKAVHYGAAFRGKVLSVESDCYGRVQVRFHKLPRIERANLILPEELLHRIERQAMGMTRHAERLKAAGRHLKRGILMHGKPGTGKTLSAMYLAAQMPGRTVVVLTGGAVGSIEIACQLARMLEPATIVLEDVDLIGTAPAAGRGKRALVRTSESDGRSG